MDHPLLHPGEHVCPAHEDRRPSLSVRQGDDGRWLLHCHGGCPIEDVLAAAGLTWRDLFPVGTRAGRAVDPPPPDGLPPCPYPSDEAKEAWDAVIRQSLRADARRREYLVAYAVADQIREGWKIIKEVRAVIKSLGPDDPRAWDLAERTARCERQLLDWEAQLDG